jgi:hypothetical protein
VEESELNDGDVSFTLGHKITRFLMQVFGSADSATPPDYVAAWCKILIGGDSKAWVLFKNGTVVMLTEPEGDLRSQAIALMSEWGPVRPACSAGDFSAVKLTDHPGWVVTCHHEDILTYIDPSEVDRYELTDVAIGLHGRGKRDLDAKELNVIHVQDNRTNAPTTESNATSG